MMQQIRFIDRVLTPFQVRMQDAYEFHPSRSGPFSWGLARPLQRLAWWFLCRTGAVKPAYETRMKVTTHTIDPPGFADKIWEQKRSLAQSWGRGATRLLIGAEDYAEMMEEAVPGWFEFDMNNPGPFGLKVEVVPWMRGVLLMP